MKQAIIDAAVALAVAAGATATLDTPERNKQVVRRTYADCINANRPELLPELISAEYVGAQGEQGPSGFGRNLDELRAGFPDIRFAIHELIAENDRVVVRWTWEGTHTGRFRNLAPSGQRITTSGIAIYQLEQGKIARVWLETDRLGVLQQIGVIPPSLVPHPPP